MKAQHTTTTTTSSNSEYNYQNILNSIIENDPSFVNLDLSELHLTEEQLREIAGKIQNNNFIGNVNWGTVPPSSDELVQKIESKIVSNNQNYKHHPNDFVHGLFSSHAYIDSKENDIVKFTASERNDEQIKIRNEQLADWKVHKVFNEPEAGKYYAVTYINEKTKQMVLAHRGTIFEKLDLLKTNSPLKAHFKSVLGGQIVVQQAAAYEATKEITKYAEDNNYNLSFTGYSLGAWFAELSLYFSHQDFNYSKAKAITFDSPGSEKIMDSFKPNILSHETDFDVRNLNITTYLSAPNFVNICNRHIHKAYRLFPEITAAEYSNKIINLLNKAVPIKNYITLLSLSGDLLDSMLDSFDSEIGKPIRYEKILDWPCIEYDPKDDTLGKKAIDRVLNFIPVGSTIKDLASKLIHRNITATTLGSFLEVIDQFVIGNITVRQFLEVYKHLENDPAQGYPSKKDIISAKDQFELSYKGHFRSQEVNLSTDIINTNNKGSSDWYLAQLRKLSIDKKEIPNLVKQQLKAIKEQYTIEDKNSKDYICTTSPSIKVDDLRGQILRLIEVSKEAKKILKDRNAYTPNEATKIIEGINSNLPLSLVHNFIAREEALGSIESILSTEQCVIISAFAGTGKSTLAIEYGRRQKEEVKKIVRFINADSADKIFEAYRQLAKEFTIYTIGEKEEDIIRLVHERIANLNSTILFIFDNVEEYKDIEPYIKGIMNIFKDKAQAIITTRDKNLHSDLKLHKDLNVELKYFSKKEAASYIKESLEDRLNEEDIYKLIEEFGSKDAASPYRLSKAVAYLKENKLLKVNDYINYFKNSKDDHIETVLLLQLLEKSPLAWQILQYSAHLDPDFISIDIFKELFLIDEEKLQEPIKRLEALSLMNITYRNGQTGLQLHRLMQAITKQYINKYKEHAIDEQKIYTRLAELLDNLFPLLTDVPNEDWENAKLLYSHVIKMLNDDNIKIDELKRANLYQKLGNYNEHILCEFEETLKYHEKALKMYQELYQDNHPYIADSLNDVGLAYYKLGELKEALRYYEEALKMRQELYQGNHPDIATSFNNIGLIYGKLGYISQGLEYLEEALKMRKELYQGNHPYITASLNNIGLAYKDLGDISQGLKYFELALKMRQELYQGNHPYIADSLNNVGLAYKVLGNISQGLEYLEEALKMLQALYQGNHPDIAGFLNNIGLTYQSLGNISEGRKYLEEALKMRKELYQGNHPHIADSLNNIGLAYEKLGNNKEELEYLEEALKMRQELYQGSHPDIADSLNNVGLAYGKLGNTKEELEYLEEALNMRKALYQSNHPYIAQSLNNIGLTYGKLGNSKEELKYQETALKIRQALYQGNHYDIADSFINVGAAYEQSGDPNKALELYKQAYLMRVKTSGITHPHTKELKSYLEKNTPEFIRNNETREFILQRGDFEEVTLQIKQKIQKRVLNKIFINAVKGKWSSGKFISKLPVLGNWGVKGYVDDKYLAKQLRALSTTENIETARMLCFEAICLIAIYNPNKNFTCVKEFAKAYPALINKIATEHPEYFIDGSILRACVNDEAILRKLLGDNNLTG